jgi:hypothetical protein
LVLFLIPLQFVYLYRDLSKYILLSSIYYCATEMNRIVVQMMDYVW